jgi:hypothetical protein
LTSVAPAFRRASGRFQSARLKAGATCSCRVLRSYMNSLAYEASEVETADLMIPFVGTEVPTSCET